MAKDCPFVSRGGLKLDHALRTFALDVTGFICADFGCSTGGFTDCLLQRGAAKVYSVDTGYGVIDWKLRNDPRVIVLERTNAMHVALPEQVNLVVIDAGWTRQAKILPKAASVLQPAGQIVSLIKPHYESEESQLRKGILPRERINSVLDSVRAQINELKLAVAAETESPILGAKGNVEYLFLLRGSSPTNLHE